MLPSNREVAAPSCNALTTGIFRHDISLSFFLSLVLFYLIPDPFTTTPLGPEQSTAIARADKDVGLKESSAGPARNLPRLRGSSPVVFCRPFRLRSPLFSDSADSALDDAFVAPFFFFEFHHYPFLLFCLESALSSLFLFFSFFPFHFLLCNLFLRFLFKSSKSLYVPFRA